MFAAAIPKAEDVESLLGTVRIIEDPPLPPPLLTPVVVPVRTWTPRGAMGCFPKDVNDVVVVDDGWWW